MKYLLYSIISLSVILTACKKEVDDDTQSSVDNSICENTFSRVVPSAQRIAIGESGTKEHIKQLKVNGNTTCATVTLDDTTKTNWPKTVTVDYGNGCIDLSDGKLKSGKLFLKFDQYWDNQGATMTLTTSNYKEDGMLIEGTVVATNNGATGTVNLLSVDIADASCKTSNWEILYASSRDYKFVDVNNTPNDLLDDIVEVTGNANGTNRKGKTFDVNIIEKVVKDPNCEYIGRGVVEITPEGRAPRTVDFGDGTCDNKATVTINGNTFEFQLK